MPKILIVEDNEGIVSFLKTELEMEDFSVCAADDGRAALDSFAREKPDLVLFDIMLPELSGFEVLRRIRKTNEDTPVLLLTARDGTDDKVAGLNLGSDDYITKPFKIEELLARINALFRRVSFARPRESMLSYKDLRLKLDRMSFTIITGEAGEDNEVQLSKTEFLLLKLLVENQGKIFSRQAIIDEIWGKDHFIDENTVDVYVGYLRSKISDHTKDEFIKTVRGTGYMMI